MDQFREQQRNMDQKTIQLILLRSPVVSLQLPTLQCLQKKHSPHHQKRLPRLTIHVPFPHVKKGSQSSSGKPRKVPRSSADLLSSAKMPQRFMRPDPTSPGQNNNPQANPSEKSVSNSQPSPSTGPPAPAPASTQPTSQGTIAYDSSNADSADSVPPPNCEGMTRFQCELCGMNLSSRNCLYKHKKRKHKLTNRVDEDGGKDAGNKHVVCPECKEKQKR